MKINDIKHNHSLTDLLKVLLFSILMLAPFCSVAIRSLYVICNKNAYQSYSDTHLVDEIVQIQTYNQIQSGETYEFKYVDKLSTLTSPIFRFSEISFDLYEKFPTLPVQQYDGFLIYGANNDVYWYYGDQRNARGQLNFDFTFVASATPNSNPFTNFDIFSTKYVPQKLDNVFEYSVSKLADDQLFNWTQQTAIFSPVESMCTNLGIMNQVIPQILVYWFLLSVIYVIIDIILKSFTALTHMLGSKKA